MCPVLLPVASRLKTESFLEVGSELYFARTLASLRAAQEWSGHTPLAPCQFPVTVQLLGGAVGWALGCGDEWTVIQLWEEMSRGNSRVCVRG